MQEVNFFSGEENALLVKIDRCKAYNLLQRHFVIIDGIDENTDVIVIPVFIHLTRFMYVVLVQTIRLITSPNSFHDSFRC